MIRRNDGWRMRLWVLALVLLSVCLVGRRAAAAARAELVTIGPARDAFARYGHSALCIQSEGAPDGRCFDYGVPDGETGSSDVVWDTLRGRARFVPIAVPRTVLVATFEGQERSLWTQALPLDDAQVTALGSSLEAAVAAKKPYAYHPYYDNCTTRLRDAIDAASGGALHAGAGASQGPTFRALTEQAFSGSVPELTGMALFLGPAADRRPTAWEALFLPASLRDAVEARMGAVPKQIYERRELMLPTSTSAGRVALVFFGAVLAGAALLAARKDRRKARITLACLGAGLGLLGLLVDAGSLATVLPEFTRNWVALVLMPTDGLLAFAPGFALRYVVARLALIAVLACASAVGIVAQPLLAPVVFAALLLGASGLLLWKRRAIASAAAGAPIARSGYTTPD